MIRTGLAPVFTGLRAGLHLLMVVLAVLVMVNAAYGDFRFGLLIVCAAIVFLGTYGVGGFLLAPEQRYAGLWLAALSAEWLVLVWLTPDAAYLVFPLFFVYLHLLNRWAGPLAVVVSAVAAILVLGVHNGFNAGAIIGPLIGAAVAIGFALGYQALYHESEERRRLIEQLRAAQQQLTITERERGILDERSRLAAEIHDTVAQGLSSIQMLLHAAERAAPDGPGIEHVTLARQTAAQNLAEARRLVRELSPAPLVEATLASAVQRICTDTAKAYGFDADVVIVGEPAPLPMSVETALLRIAQSVLGNVAKHAECTRSRITLTYLDSEVRLDIVDDGIGFDTTHHLGTSSVDGNEAREDSFGFGVMRQRVERLGGSLVIESSSGQGTAVSVAFEVDR